MSEHEAPKGGAPRVDAGARRPSEPATAVGPGGPAPESPSASARVASSLAQRSSAMDEVRFRASGGRDGVAPGSRERAGRQSAAASAVTRFMRKASGAASAAPAIPQGGGAPLPSGTKAQMERRLGADLSGVKVHTGGESAQAATQLGARAFTVGSDVHFSAGQFAPGTKEGDRLIAHELTHVVQGQRSPIVRKADGDDAKEAKEGGAPEVSDPSEPAEKEADAMADHVADDLHADGGEKKDEKDDDKGGGKGKGGKEGDDKGGDEKKAPAAEETLDGVGRKVFRSAAPGAGGGGAAAAGGGAASSPAVATAMTGVDGSAASLKQRLAEIQAKRDILKAMAIPAVGSISAEVAMSAFITAGNSLFDQWDTFTTPDARIGVMGGAANTALGAVGVPAVKQVAPIDGTESSFDKSAWKISVGKAPFTAKPPRERLPGVCSTVYHEARHAEQYFNIARLLAGRGKVAADVAKEAGNIPPDVAQAAVAKKMAPDDPQLRVSEELLRVLNDPDTQSFLEELKSCVEAFNAAATNEAKMTVLKNLISPRLPRYKALAPEADAFGLEAKLQQLWAAQEHAAAAPGAAGAPSAGAGGAAAPPRT